MLVKFQSSSNRVKNCSFHPTQPLLLIALHNGSVQLYNYLLGTLINTFYAHNGPVRGISFHPKQALFVSGGDDYLIKLYNYKTTNQPSVLIGHLDYIRSVYFHDELSWIISSSDDQTLRIWNYLNRTCIAILTGHNHYCMHAVFSPSNLNNFIISCSLDQTIRIWDYTVLKTKHTTNKSSSGGVIGDSFQMDCTVKFVLEGHDRGVNWVQHHPTQPLIVSAADDRQVKVWRIGESRAWELSSFRGHYNNVSSCCFHPFLDLILSNSEDKSIRVWDINKRIMVNTFKRDNDRFWCITNHPNQALFACGHDSGVIVFKLQRERPPISVFNNLIYTVRNNAIIQFNTIDSSESTAIPISVQCKHMEYNNIEQSFLLNGQSEVNLINPNNNQSISFTGTHGVFISRNRCCILNNNTLQIYSTDNANPINSIPLAITPTNLYSYIPGHVLLLGPSNVQIVNVLGNSIVYDFHQTNKFKYANVSTVNASANDNPHICLIGKHEITIFDHQLKVVAQVHETLRIKSSIWSNNILIYTTLNHIKYSLLNGHVGIIKSIHEPLYLASVSTISDNSVVIHAITRQSTLISIPIDPTEYLFKLALINKDMVVIQNTIKNGNLMGQSIINHLQSSGYATIALEFVKDPLILFELAIQCGELHVAYNCAKTINNVETWQLLATTSMSFMNSKLVESSLQASMDLDLLSFLYLINGNLNKLNKMMDLHSTRSDANRLYNIALLVGNNESKLKILMDNKQYGLAYLLCLNNKMDTTKVLQFAPKNFVQLPASAASSIGGIDNPNDDLYVWPLKDTELDDSAITPSKSVALEDNSSSVPNKLLTQSTNSTSNDVPATANTVTSAINDDLTVWGDDLDIPDVPEQVMGLNDYIIAGLFDEAIQVLINKYSIINVPLLKEPMTRIYTANNTSYNSILGTIPVHLNVQVYTSDFIKTQISNALSLTTQGQFIQAIAVLKHILKCTLFVTVDPQDLNLCTSYLLGLRIELKRREETDINRQIQLSVYFTNCNLKPQHLELALRSMVGLSFKNKYYKTCLLGSRRLNDISENEDSKNKVLVVNLDQEDYWDVRNESD
eukprot:NODE_92_length_21718_cov_0.361950.p1 type:complete len:1076 gc:universal NODE_92_length_21718_cov_0.361950:4737-1510(-)